jgi:hypothetical protein
VIHRKGVSVTTARSAPLTNLGPHRNFLQPISLNPLTDLHEQRAQELRHLGYHVAADRILNCGRLPGIYRRRSCKQRLCPTCGPRSAQARAQKVAQVIEGMSNPILGLFRMRSRHLRDLRNSYSDFRSALTVITRQAQLRSAVPRAIGGIEIEKTRAGDAWLPHLHLVLDAIGYVDELELNRRWKALTGGRGYFSLDYDPKVERPKALACYIMKSRTWCPPPGSCDLDDLILVRKTLHGRRLIVQWGIKR